jgi:formylglycine-generating enzyme required for sulfatase activity
VVQAVEDFVQKYGKQSASRFLVTCRTYSFSHDSKWQLTGWATHELALLDEEKINHFINAWHDEHIRIEPARKPDLEHKREQLLLSLQPDDRRRLHEIAPFPIILTMMAVVHTHYGELPDTRAEVYDRCVDLLLVRWELERSVDGLSKETKKRNIIDELGLSSRGVLDRALREIAYKAHEGREDGGQNKRGPALVTEELLISILNAQFQDLAKVQIFLDYCRSSNGLLMLQGSVIPAGAPEGSPPRNVYAFPHLTFEEYLAARYLVRPNFGKTTFELVQKSDRWREVVLLLGEYLCFFQGGDQERMEILLNAFIPKNIPVDREHSLWRAVWYSGDLLSLFRRAFPRDMFPREKEIKDGLYKLVTIGALSPRERASAADTLDELGYIPEGLYEFAEIRRNDLSRYYLSKRLVTNIQYERFLKPENFQNKALWVDFPKYDENSKPMKETWGGEPWNWLQKALQDKDNEIQDGVLLPRYWRDPRFGVNRRHAPVVGISWYEASAYCKWLTQQKDLPELAFLSSFIVHPSSLSFRLPTETEWSLAAGGEANERFAFGELKDPKKEITAYANTDESGINRTTPVWMYPQGASPTGAMDMSGNVWEWQANYKNVKQGYLGLRGGSWDLYGGLARVSFRNYYPPNLGSFDVGFRVVAASLPNG